MLEWHFTVLEGSAQALEDCFQLLEGGSQVLEALLPVSEAC